MTLVESHMLAKESQTNRVNEYDSFITIMTLLQDRLTLFILCMQELTFRVNMIFFPSPFLRQF